MTIQIVNISFQDVFNRYSKKYNIFRDLYEKDLLGLEIRNIENELCEKVKNIFLQNGEICYITENYDSDKSDFLALGSYSILKELSREILSAGNEDLGYKISKVFERIKNYHSQSFYVDNIQYKMDTSYVMGILNVTPDSFSDGGKFLNHEDAVNQALRMLNEGADFIDIGGESTRPGSSSVTIEEELKRVIPVVEQIIEKRPEAIISIDTTKSLVAKEALNAGAKIVNDISAGTFDVNMLKVVKEFNANFIMMHMQGKPEFMQKNPHYNDVVTEVFEFMCTNVEKLEKAGIKKIIIDPGIGFGKRVFDNYELLKRLDEFKAFGYPILIGLSRKSFLGKSLNLNVEDRDNPTSVAETISALNGAVILRTHNVKNAVEAKKIINFVKNPDFLSNV